MPSAEKHGKSFWNCVVKDLCIIVLRVTIPLFWKPLAPHHCNSLWIDLYLFIYVFWLYTVCYTSSLCEYIMKISIRVRFPLLLGPLERIMYVRLKIYAARRNHQTVKAQWDKSWLLDRGSESKMKRRLICIRNTSVCLVCLYCSGQTAM